MHNTSIHSFFIPVMGIGYTIDSPIKVAPYGISSVISLVDDGLMERMRKIYSEKFDIPFREISEKFEDFRAERITAYLNTVNDIVKKKFEDIKSSAFEQGSKLQKYLDMLPDYSELKKEYAKMLDDSKPLQKIQKWIQENIIPGSIDVNIMTKLDKSNISSEGDTLPVEYNDAHAALRGFARSNLESSIVFSAGLNPSLYGFLEKYDDFYPDEQNYIKKKIVLKVSDYRSAIIQGKFFAKKGLWVSEYRIESGLNCGGHAFATDGYLMGPILEEFKNNRDNLLNDTFRLLADSLQKRNRHVPDNPPPVRITAQGGVGNSDEHHFLLEYYNLDAVGWGTPFLLVPEAVTIDEETLELLSKAEENDLYLSDISPLNVPFNSVKGNTKDEEKKKLIAMNRPGSSCPKRYLAFNKDYDDRGLCSASRRYQYLKIKELKSKDLPPEIYEREYEKIVEKSCICVGLGTSALLVHGMDTSKEGEGVSVCPGPNMAYFEGKRSLQEMIDHIYGRIDLTVNKKRPNLFLKELNMYYDYFKNKVDELQYAFTERQVNYLEKFRNNLNNGIEYYKNLFSEYGDKIRGTARELHAELEKIENRLNTISIWKKEGILNGEN